MRSPSGSPTHSDRISIIPASPGNLRGSIIVGLLCLIVYSANFRSISAGDAYPARYLPFAIWKWHTVLLDPIEDITSQGRIPVTPRAQTDSGLWHGAQPQDAFWIVQLPADHTVSLYPLVVPVLVSPLYLPAVVYLNSVGWDQQHLDQVARIMEKVSASLLAAISAAFFYSLVRRRAGPGLALVLTFAYAFGTNTWVISSQALWQHGAAELLVVWALLLLTGPCTRNRVIATGIVLGLIACNRPPDSVIALALGVYGVWWGKRHWPFLVAATLVPAVPLLVYNLGIVGHIAGAYGLIGNGKFFQHNPLQGLAGLLFSPTRGLFVFSPFLLFVPLFLPRILRDKSTYALTMVGLAAVVVQLLIYAPTDWRQGGSWGPRWLTDLVPILVWMLPPVLIGLNRAARAVFVASVGVAILIQAIGAFWYTGTSIAGVYAASTGSNPMQAAWYVRNAPFVSELGHAPAPMELTAEVRGFVDVMTVNYGPGGRELDLVGWALSAKHAPQEVVALIDGRPAASTAAFSPRLDVNSALGAEGPAGWSLAIPATGLGPGEHLVAVLARAYQGGDLRLFAQRKFLEKPDLSVSARRAAEIVATRQQAAGYWLTSHTTQPRFENPKQELNTYLPAVMVDVLNPVAKKGGLEDHLERARRFLTAQIESNGLVRYHGLPNAPTIGTLGCAITPDADDTALVWRIAPGARRELLRDAIGALAAYRTKEGLYRTWLAPKEHYECIDPGADPDPADIGIQMHIFLMLSQADPAGAKALCGTLQRAINDDSKWVYYKNAPPIPILRQADLQEAGCSVEIPESHRRTTVVDQDLWVSAALAVERSRLGGSQRPDPAEVRRLLQRIAEDDFLFLRRSPPLLYHNDQTASVSRYYWSEEFGYALWLRLYFELDNPAAGGAQ